MLQLKDSIFIQRSVNEIYRVISDLEGHVRLLPGYLESKILDGSRERCRLRRRAIIHGRERTWVSDVEFKPDEALLFRQSEGPLRGMQVRWEIQPFSGGSVLTISHDVHVTPRWRGWWIERFVAQPAIEKTARLVLESIKTSLESRATLS